jgi:multiple sugar transport system permease protein
MRNRKRVGWHRYVNGVTSPRRHRAVHPAAAVLADRLELQGAERRRHAAALPQPVQHANYSNAFVQYDFGIYFRNSLIVTIIATALVLFLGTLAGYALGRLPMRGKFPRW